ncbi:MAG: 50S ribosomal protein L25 [Planctomycetes bacterium]|nr:50S ribosomal protein L25 [Planctomycetota bacterium]
MEWVKIKAESRKEKGSTICRHLRKKGLVPGIVYGRKEPEEQLVINAKELSEMLHKGVRLIDLAFPDKTEKVFVKEVQVDPISEAPIHIDFSRIAMDEMLTMEVEIILKGQPKGILAGGLLEQNLRQLTIKCLPNNIPDSIEVDVAGLDMGDLVRVKEMKLPQGVSTVTDAEIVVAGVHQPKEEEVAAPAGEISTTEPEVITAKKEETEEGEEGKKGTDDKKAAVKEEKKPAKEEKK